nr:MAG: hypothetical protein [Bacteriophage sp.]
MKCLSRMTGNCHVRFLGGKAVVTPLTQPITPWWLATPYGTPNCSPYTVDSSFVWRVSTDGSYGGYWYGGSCGVRPALYFPSTLWVSTEDEGEAGFCLADVPLDDLLAEIKSRAEE